VAYTGRTVAFARATPVADVRVGIDERYEAAERDLLGALADLGVDARPGEPPDSFCPGSHSLQAGGKLVGLAQRVGRGAALTAGVCVVAERGAVADVLDPVYEALDHPFDPASVGSVAAAGGPDDPDRVARAIEDALVDDRERRVERVDG
jgi:lipoate-protein ligase A